MQSIDTRERLLEAAASLMWERSFQATGVDELCQRAEAKKGSFYHYFPSKTDLAIAAIERAWRQVEEGIFKVVFSTEVSGLIQIQNLIAKVYEVQGTTASESGGVLGCPFANLGQEMARQDERIRVALHRIFEFHCDYLEAALNRAQLAGEIPPGNSRVRAESIFALLEGALVLAKVANDPEVLLRMVSRVPAIAAG